MLFLRFVLLEFSLCFASLLQFNPKRTFRAKRHSSVVLRKKRAVLEGCAECVQTGAYRHIRVAEQTCDASARGIYEGMYKTGDTFRS